MHFYSQTLLFFVFAAVLMLLVFGLSGNSAVAGSNGNAANGAQTNSLVYSIGNFFASAQASALFFALAVFVVAFYGAYWLKSN